ncbi:DegT/DnrJ/EryC1/StrS family aminotransferase [Paracoccus jeotgali]|uniref:DegT/DnrJ/EryC1/StrS family aminotransferase n=1 Tax=Paracoccus jeotgali TaxID=2065379 RepID=A0A2K9MHI2_9RHOB|nr:DegT/DnrJ/EryC1/StrS family aminotransferase [Paracoccus jeotgali]AUM75098.1 DegT/DnrJ/EryC1/StrS family aminotransferase [Paracoccus jeotgali]
MERPSLVVAGQPLMPRADALTRLMSEALDAGFLTNGGVLHQRLESEMQGLLGAPGRLVSSGTMALMLALRMGGLPEGAEIVTTPLTFAATVQAIRWCGFRPIFADVDPVTLTLCPRAAEAAITPRTAAILPVHFLGHICDVAAFDDLARRRGLWLVYDAAHAFGQTVHDRSVASFGDLSAFSLHATKLMHSAEGGAVAGPAADVEQLARLRNFGLQGGRMTQHGTNAKMSECNAAMGLAVLPLLPAEIAARDALRAAYDAALQDIPGVTPLAAQPGVRPGLIYYSLMLPPPKRMRLLAALAEGGILARDHFPLLSGQGTCLPDARIVTVSGEPVAPSLAPRLISLPFHGKVTGDDVARIAAITRKVAETADP